MKVFILIISMTYTLSAVAPNHAINKRQAEGNLFTENPQPPAPNTAGNYPVNPSQPEAPPNPPTNQQGYPAGNPANGGATYPYRTGSVLGGSYPFFNSLGNPANPLNTFHGNSLFQTYTTDQGNHGYQTYQTQQGNVMGQNVPYTNQQNPAQGGSQGNYPANPAGYQHPLGPSFPLHLPNFPGMDTGYNNHFEDFYNHLDTHFPQGPNSKCVKSSDIDDLLATLSNSTEGYPFEAIKEEMDRRTDLVSYLPPPLSETTPGVYDVDYSYSCPTMLMRLRSFQRYGGRCWVMSNIHEVNYGYCAKAYCNSHHMGNSFYSRNMCMEHYDTLHLWAYCENTENPQFRIRQETVRVPKYCSCKNIMC